MNRQKTSLLAIGALVVVVILAALAFGAGPSALDELAQTERDFARLSVKEGMRVAFDANFADDGIWFTPHPSKTREDLAKRAAKKQGFILDWYPTLSDVAAAGDLGYNTGPVIISDESEQRRPLEHGYFFSVWKRQPDGAWKVAVDFGTKVLGPSAAETRASWRGARHEAYAAKGRVSLDAERDGLRRREEELARAVRSKGLPVAYRESLAGDFRVYRQEELPFLDTARLTARLETEQARGQLAWEPTAVDVARSADLGITWGSYAVAGKAAEPVEKGYYAHVWRRTARGEWRLAIEVMRGLPPLPPQAKAPSGS